MVHNSGEKANHQALATGFGQIRAAASLSGIKCVPLLLQFIALREATKSFLDYYFLPDLQLNRVHSLVCLIKSFFIDAAIKNHHIFIDQPGFRGYPE
jgi:hypothetical protein